MLALLAALVALGPLTVDMYLPAMPGMMLAFDTDIAHMHLTLSAYLWGFSVFHLFCGPLADRFGRRPILLWGTALFVLASVGCALSTSVEELIAYRLLQGIGACVGPTLARTVTRDLFGPQRAARALSLIAMLMALAPAVAPGLGGIMLRFLPWPAVFFFLTAYGLVVFFLISRYLEESLPAPQTLHPIGILRNYAELVREPVFLAVCTASALVYAGLMAYLASSGFVFVNMLGVPVEYFGLIFLSSVIGYMLGSAISARLALNRSSEAVVLLGCCLSGLSTLVMALANHLWPLSVLGLVLPMTLYSLSLGLVLPHAMAMALRPFPHIAGTASALQGFIQMGLSAVATAMVGGLLADRPTPMISAMIVLTLCALAIAVLVYRYLRTRPPAPGLAAAQGGD